MAKTQRCLTGITTPLALYGADVLKRLTLVVLSSSLAGGGGGGADRAETSSLEACRVAVEGLSGAGLEAAEPPWRLTSRREADGFAVNIWTGTPRAEQRPTGDPDYVCKTARDDSSPTGVRLVEVRPQPSK